MLLDDHGVTNAAELFVVVIECFFEKPRQLGQEYRELFDELKQVYQQTSAEWHPLT